LLSGVRSGRIPVPRHVDPLTSAEARLRLSLFQSGRATQHGRCKALDHAVTRTLETGQALRIDGGGLQISTLQDPRAAVIYNPASGGTLTAVRGPLELRLASTSRVYFFWAALCE
jgi:hypothetical protein